MILLQALISVVVTAFISQAVCPVDTFSAHTVTGRVCFEYKGQCSPIPKAQLLFLTTDGKTIASESADQDGNFTLTPKGAHKLRIRVRADGFSSV
jgi:hypothetical protein